MRARDIGLLLGGGALAVGAAWIWLGRAKPQRDASLPAPPTTGASAPDEARDTHLDDWPAGFGDSPWPRSAATAPDPDSPHAESEPSPAQVRVVVSWAGAPFVRPARIAFTRAGGSTPIHDYGEREEFAWPGDTNEVALSVASGLWTARALSEDLESLARPVFVPTSGGEPLVLALEPQCRWYGVLLTATDDPAAGVAVRVVGREGNELDSTRSDAGGRFELSAVQRPGSRVEVGDASRAALVQELPPDCGAVQLGALKLPPLASLTLEFDRNGREQDTVQVMLQGFQVDQDGRSSVRVFAPGESVRFDDLAPGRYRVYLYLPDARGNLSVNLVPGTQAAVIPLRAGRPRR
jgi:hypothetical protein